MRLKVFFLIIVVYILGAFGWLTYSLLNFSQNEYELKNQVLKAGRQDCILNLIEAVRRGELSSIYNDTLYLRELQLVADTGMIQRFVQQRYKSHYSVIYFSKGTKRFLEVSINEAQRKKLKEELLNQKRIFLFESLLLALLVGIGVFGVYYSVNLLYTLNKQQNNFLLSVTHELKTPIAAVKLMLQTLIMRDLPPEKMKVMLHSALENTERLNDLTLNMLTAMQIENRKYRYDSVQFNLSDMIADAAENFRYKAEINTDIEPGILHLGDPFIFRMAINNLIENAIKYSDAKPVDVKFSVQNNYAQIEIADRGIGVSKKDQKKIFRKFYRVQDEEVRDTQGTGLGLFIVKESLSRQKAKVWVEPNITGGSRFFIRFRLVKGLNENLN